MKTKCFSSRLLCMALCLFTSLLGGQKWGIATSAQEIDSSQPQHYDVSYYHDHVLLRQDSNFTVVDADVEWPEAIDFANLSALQREICQLLFDADTTSFADAYSEFKQALGTPVKSQLASLPDDRRFCYVDISLHIKDYQPQKWITFELSQKTAPESLSPVKAGRTYRMITFDLVDQQVLTTEDLLRGSRVEDISMEDFYSLFGNLDDDTFYDMDAADVDGVWLDRRHNLIGLHILCKAADRVFNYTRLLPHDDWAFLLTRTAEKMWKGKKDKNEIKPVFTSLPLTWKGDTVYKHVAQMPVYQGKEDALTNYYKQIVAPVRTQLDADMHGNVVVAFIVNKEGLAEDVRVLSPICPDLDRHAVSVIKGMSRWQPGAENGQPKMVRIYQTFKY